MSLSSISTGVLILATALGISANAATYDVGPGQGYTTIGSVPWYRLSAGDVVNIHYKSGCYAEKFLISTQGASWQNPITVQGIPNAQGQLPCITGQNAIQSSTSHDRWSGAASAQYSESLYVIGISLQSGASNGPTYIVLSNLEVTGAAAGQYYTADDGTRQVYGDGVSAVRVVNGNHIKIQNCYFHDILGSGIFGKPNGSFPGSMADIELFYNHFANNGVPGNYLYHNSYLEADRTVYIGNEFDPLISGAPGTHLKDRSAGTVVAYNRFHGPAGRYVDLVEPQDGWDFFGAQPYYGVDFVYGNIFEASDTDTNFDQMGHMIHYGGDQGMTQYYRNRTLSFYDNTVVIRANSSDVYKIGIFEPELSSAQVQLTNNIIFMEPASGTSAPELDLSASNYASPSGKFIFGSNWISPGWYLCSPAGQNCSGASASGTANIKSPSNNNPYFKNLAADDYTLASGSVAIGSASALPSIVTNNALNSNFTPTLQYVPDRQTASRASLADLGAYAASASPGCTYSLSSSGLSISSNAYSGQITLTTQSGCNWNASSSGSWLTVQPSSGSGTATLTFSAQANTSTALRSASILASGQQFSVSQSGQAVVTCSYQASPASISVPNSQSSGQLSLTTSSGCSWSLSSSGNWISLQSTSGTGSATVAYTIQPNTSSSARSAAITAQGQLISVTQAGGQTSGGSSPIAIDARVWTDLSQQSSTITSPAFSTNSGNELLLALVSTDYLWGANTQVRTITGGGGTWVLVQRVNTQSGTSEIWRSFASSKLKNATVRATLSQVVDASLTIMSFSGVNSTGTFGSGAIGAVGRGTSSQGAPIASLKTTHRNSLIVGVGNDFDNPIPRTPAAGQSIVHQYMPPVGDTYWVQIINAPSTAAGITETLTDTAPWTDRYNLAICEIVPAY